MKVKELSPEEMKFRHEAEDLRQKVAEKGFETDTRLKPTAAQLKRSKKDQ